MIMRALWIVGMGLGVAGCATHSRVAQATLAAKTTSPAMAATIENTQVVGTPYAVRAYRDPNDPAIIHEAHVVLRETRVSRALASEHELDTLPRDAVPAASYAPLPPNAELAAELATQKQITTDLRSIQAKMAATQKQAEAQYGTLVNATADTLQLRQQLEAERARVRELESKLNEQQSSASPTVAATNDAQAKW
jgi:hypothetical protein